MTVKDPIPGWVVDLVLATMVAGALLTFGSGQAVRVLGVMFAWFLALGLLGLGAEALWQAARGAWRRRRRGPPLP